MKLLQYLEEVGLSYAAFAAKVGVTPSSVSRIANGKRIPRADLAERITIATKGKVKLADLVPDQPK